MEFSRFPPNSRQFSLKDARTETERSRGGLGPGVHHNGRDCINRATARVCTARVEVTAKKASLTLANLRMSALHPPRR